MPEQHGEWTVKLGADTSLAEIEAIAQCRGPSYIEFSKSFSVDPFLAPYLIRAVVGCHERGLVRVNRPTAPSATSSESEFAHMVHGSVYTKCADSDHIYTSDFRARLYADQREHGWLRYGGRADAALIVPPISRVPPLPGSTAMAVPFTSIQAFFSGYMRQLNGPRQQSLNEYTDMASELLDNAVQHAAVSASGSAVGTPHGILAFKIPLNAERFRDAALGPVNAYLDRVRERQPNPRAFVAGFCVYDVGAGIAGTLGGIAPTLSTKELVTAALTSGFSRLATSTPVRRGLGLPSVIRTAKQVNALILVSTNDVMACVDGTAAINDLFFEQGALLRATQGSAGTAVTVLLPPDGGLQLSLFGGSATDG